MLQENQTLKRLVRGWSRHPDRFNDLLEGDAELIQLDEHRFLALMVDFVVEEIKQGLYDLFLAKWMAVAGRLSDLGPDGRQHCRYFVINVSLGVNYLVNQNRRFFADALRPEPGVFSCPPGAGFLLSQTTGYAKL